MSHFTSLLNASPSSLAPDYPHFWARVGGVDGWRSCMSVRQTEELVGGDERVLFRLPRLARGVPAGLVAYVLSRLPCLEELSVRGMGTDLLLAKGLAGGTRVFPCLSVADLSFTRCTDDDLDALVRVVGRPVTLDVTGCLQLSWAAIARAQAAGWTVTPASEQAKADSDQQRSRQLELLDYGSPASKQRYDELYSRYGRFLGKNGEAQERGLVSLWNELGGNAWCDAITPTELTLLLSREAIDAVNFRFGSKVSSAGYDASGEVTDPDQFATHLLSRIPSLKGLQLIECPRWPLDFEAMEALDVDIVPFRQMLKLGIRITPCTARQLLEVVERMPTLNEENGFFADLEYTDFITYTKTEVDELSRRMVILRDLDSKLTSKSHLSVALKLVRRKHTDRDDEAEVLVKELVRSLVK